jgi:hypothetical protein
MSDFRRHGVTDVQAKKLANAAWIEKQLLGQTNETKM